MADINSLSYLDNRSLYSKLIKVYGNEQNYIDTIKANVSKNKTPYLEFAPFKLPDVRQAFSTRLGGVSKGMYESMNLTFNPVGEYAADDKANVKENFERMAEVLDTSIDRMVYTKQTHTNNVKVVDEVCAGMGVIRERSFDNIDGLVTNTKNLCLVSSYADCIPLTLYDKNKKVIAVLHAGWKGTVTNIAKNGLKLMKDSFECDMKDVIAFVGPGICKSCYEVSADVAKAFTDNYTSLECKLIIENGVAADKYQLDLISANYINLANEGILPSNIYVADVCTSHNKDILFSHRASGGKRGIMCNFIYLK